MSGAVRGFRKLPDGCCISDTLRFPTEPGHTFPLLQPGKAPSATYLGFLLVTLKGISFICLESCLLSSICAS